MKNTSVWVRVTIGLVVFLFLYLMFSMLSVPLSVNAPELSTKNEPRSSNGVNISNNTPIEQRYYPNVPKKVTSPEIVVKAYFDSLYFASNLNPTQKNMAGGTVGMDKEPYPTAYGYWSQSWQAKHTFNEFLSSWEGTAQVQLLKMIPAEVVSGRQSFFVETKEIKVFEGKGSGIFYYSGLITVSEESEGWQLIEENMKPENMAWEIGGHRPGQANPEEVALAEITKSVSTPLGTSLTINNPDGTVTVKFLDSNSKELYQVVMLKLQEGTFRVINKSVSR